MNILIGSVRGSPGVTSLSVMLTHIWSRDCILIEADITAPVLAARYNLKQGELLNFVTSCRHSVDASISIDEYQYLPGGVPVITASGKSSTTESLLKELPLRDISEILPEKDIFFDLGRVNISTCPENLLLAADLLILVVQPWFEHLDPLLFQVSEHKMHKTNLGVVVVNAPERSNVKYTGVEIDNALRSISGGQVGVIGDLPYDPKAAHICATKGPGSGSLRKSPFIKSVEVLEKKINKYITEKRGADTQSTRDDFEEKSHLEKSEFENISGEEK